MMWWHGDLSWWGWSIMTIGMLALWAVIAWVIVFVTRNANASPSARTPRDILAERYAHGEIDADEYHRRLDDVRHDSAAR